MRTSLKRKNLLPEGANSFLPEGANSFLKGQAVVGPTVKSGQWHAPRINGFSELSQVMSTSVRDCKHAGCWTQLIYWNVCTFVVEDDWCKILKICTL